MLCHFRNATNGFNVYSKIETLRWLGSKIWLPLQSDSLPIAFSLHHTFLASFFLRTPALCYPDSAQSPRGRHVVIRQAGVFGSLVRDFKSLKSTPSRMNSFSLPHDFEKETLQIFQLGNMGSISHLRACREDKSTYCWVASYWKWVACTSVRYLFH